VHYALKGVLNHLFIVLITKCKRSNEIDEDVYPLSPCVGLFYDVDGKKALVVTGFFIYKVFI
jgi:hypothetical protein